MRSKKKKFQSKQALRNIIEKMATKEQTYRDAIQTLKQQQSNAVESNWSPTDTLELLGEKLQNDPVLYVTLRDRIIWHFTFGFVQKEGQGEIPNCYDAAERFMQTLLPGNRIIFERSSGIIEIT